jgi:hypothetical protein
LKAIEWRALAASFLIMSVLVYAIEFALFKDIKEIYIWFLGCLAFLPLQVLFVTFFLQRSLEKAARIERLEKLNLVVGAFFSEVGRGLLVAFSNYDQSLVKIRKELVMKPDWGDAEFDALVKRLAVYDYGVEIERVDLKKLREHLLAKREFLLRLMENPNLLEHEYFTDLLRAIFHVIEELEAREDFSKCPPADIAHIRGDLNRAYKALVGEWLAYMLYLKKEYPYLFHLAMRQNPFDEAASVIVEE